MAANTHGGERLIALLTDFGTQDGYVGAMKGVLYAGCPSARLVDVTHEVPPQDVLAGAFALAQAAPFFPSGTIFVGVVDPGVGSSRRALVVEANGQLFVGPDNGLFALAATGKHVARAIDRVPKEWRVHPTFHGRDLFARVAAALAAGLPAVELASEIVEPVGLDVPRPERVGDELYGEVIHVDRFGNLVTNVPSAALPGGSLAGLTVEVAGIPASSGTTYADVERGRLVAYPGSAGYVEVAVRDGSAQALLSAGRGARVRLSARAT